MSGASPGPLHRLDSAKARTTLTSYQIPLGSYQMRMHRSTSCRRIAIHQSF